MLADPKIDGVLSELTLLGMNHDPVRMYAVGWLSEKLTLNDDEPAPENVCSPSWSVTLDVTLIRPHSNTESCEALPPWPHVGSGPVWTDSEVTPKFGADWFSKLGPLAETARV